MFKTRVEPRAAAEWFHWQVLDILFIISRKRARTSDVIGDI